MDEQTTIVNNNPKSKTGLIVALLIIIALGVLVFAQDEKKDDTPMEENVDYNNGQGMETVPAGDPNNGGINIPNPTVDTEVEAE